MTAGKAPARIPHEDPVWGREVVRRDSGVPYLVFAERPPHLVAVLEQCRRWAGRTAVKQGPRAMSFEELIDASDRVGAALHERGVRRHDRVLILGFNSVDWIVTLWGVLRLGAVPVLGNAWWGREEIAGAVADVAPSLVLTTSPIAIPDLPVDVLSSQQVMAQLSQDDEWESPAAWNDVHEDEPAVILFTSGTSGRPKGAVLSHRSVVAMQHMLLFATHRLPVDIPDDFSVSPVLQTGPLFHIGGVQTLIRTLITGSVIVLTEGKFDPSQVLHLIEHERIERWGGVPTMMTRVLGEPSIDGRDLTSLRSLTLGGSVVQPEIIRRIKRHFPNVQRGVGQIYGLSEAGGTLCSASGRDTVDRPDSVGRPLPLVELIVASPDAAGVGSLLARTPTQMSGYFGVPAGDDVAIG
ncbi:MAG TPA: class I adenylate-forming enzyme family protein, partial [Propionibacteriaceae bacterium]